VLEAVAALGDVDLAPPVILGTWSFDLHDPTNCHECRIPFDDDAQSAEDAHCPWCGARKPEHLQELVWAELTTIELAYPESVGA
jgi:hypothetical protein